MTQQVLDKITEGFTETLGNVRGQQPATVMHVVCDSGDMLRFEERYLRISTEIGNQQGRARRIIIGVLV